jgi:predicted lipoprotein with Yx(FWY)xxD motif
MLALLALVLGLSACSSSEEAPSGGGGEAAQPAAGTEVKVADSKLGKVLSGPEGRTLYAFTVDKDGKSACYDQCAKAWPALTVKGDPAPEWARRPRCWAQPRAPRAPSR